MTTDDNPDKWETLWPASDAPFDGQTETDLNEDDFDFVYEDVTVLVDAMSMQYLQNAEIKYNDSDMGSSFVINNPQAQTTCGCGSSFSV